MRRHFNLYILIILSFIVCSLSTCFAQKKPSYVIYLGAHSHGPDLSPFDLHQVKQSHYNFLGSFLGSNKKARDAIFYSYTRHINGFAANLHHHEAAEIARHPKVVSVFENRGRKLHTTRSWEFMGLENNKGVIPSYSAWEKASYGQDTIIGNLDTGVWPESKSFSEQGLGPIPSKWKGICQNGLDSTFHCNRKLIGARYFNKGYASEAGISLNSSHESPRDNEGHGTHTLSTAGGNMVANANVFGFGNGTAKGGSPKARVVAYKVCWPPVKGNECFDADILAAFDIAIHDGVDVLSVSLGGDPTPFFNDSVSIGSFHAVKHGIVVVCSAGNSGPAESTVSNLSPWHITVGASTMDRQFPAYVVLGNNESLRGESLSQQVLPHNKFFPLITSTDAKAANASIADAKLCKAGTLDRKKVKGKILVCIRGENARVDKGQQAALSGAVGMILANDVLTDNEIIADPHVLPASHITYTISHSLFKYINSTHSPIAYITPPTTELGTKPAPFMAAFSSKGPNSIAPDILKPDITAPGVSVIAAYSEAQAPTNQIFDKRRVQFNSVSGTSMSCPHISGIAGLLKTIHPHWTPAAIKSAIMTSASTKDNSMELILNASYIKATPFSYGAGHVRPNRAVDPGLVYDIQVNDHLDYLCALGYNNTLIALFSSNDTKYTCPKEKINIANLNYPSITIPELTGESPITITRTVKNVGLPGTYRARIREPVGVSIIVNPKSLKFEEIGEEKTFSLTLKKHVKKSAHVKGYAFGKLIWSDNNKHHVTSPIVVKVV